MAAPSQHHLLRTNASNSPSSDGDATVTVAKKPHPIPWTHEETVNLIYAYQEKWYSLKRGQLKASQWEEVAVTIAVRCRSSSSPSFSKTGTQCRHKIEKLRKRYRAEKQRPNSSAWPYFDLMDRMERGPLPISAVHPVATLNRQHDFDDDDEEYGEADDGDDEDYEHEIAVKRRRFEPRVSTERKLDQFGHKVDPFLKNGKKLGELKYGDPRLRFCSNPSSTNSRFQKRKLPYGAVEQEEDDQDDDEVEEEVEEVRNRGSRDVMGELAVQMKEFAESFMRMERRKMEAMRETQRYRMEMENKRTQMILVAQQKTVDMISRAFDAAAAAAAASSSSPTSSSPSSSSPSSDKKFQMGR